MSREKVVSILTVSGYFDQWK